MRLSTRLLSLALVVLAVPVLAQMKSGFEMTNFREVMGVTKAQEATGYTVTFINASAPGTWLGRRIGLPGCRCK